MSFHSCYRYVLGLPTSTLESMVVGALSEDETAGVPAQFTRPGVAIGDGLTANVTASITDPESATLEVPGTDVDLTLGLNMRLEVEVVEMPALDPIEYALAFTMPGEFGRREPPGEAPELMIHFPSVAAADLNLAVSGGDIVLSGELLQPLIDAAIAANPDVLGVKVKAGVSIPPSDTGSVFSEIFHDDPGAPDFRGRITGSMPDPSTLELLIPGHLRVIVLGSPPIIDSDMAITVAVPVERDDAAGELRVRFDQVTSSSVTVVFSPSLSALHRPFAEAEVKGEVAATLSAFDTETQAIPTAPDLTSMIADELAAYAQDFVVAYDMPQPADPESIDISTFEPATQAGALLLLLEPLGDATPCDAVDPFVGSDGFSLVLSEPAVRPFLQQVRDTVEGSSREIQGHTVRVTSISATLSDPDPAHDPARGHLWIEGNADVEIDCWPDAGVDFWGPVYLAPRHQPDGLYFDATTGEFGAEDDTSCEDVDPNDVAALIDSERFGPFDGLPTEFGGVGAVDLEVMTVDIFAAGMVLHGSFALTTLTQLSAGLAERRTFWAHEGAAGS
ncbi:MAG: hypothetical protein AAGM22_05210 [Acidobacteriota bacterium]